MSRFSIRVEVRGLEGIANPEGRTIERALPVLGFEGVSELDVGRIISFTLDASDEASARSEVEKMCAALLANPVIERTEISLAPELAS